MYICIYVYMCVYIYMYVYVCMYVCMYVFMYVCTYMHTDKMYRGYNLLYSYIHIGICGIRSNHVDTYMRIIYPFSGP